MAKPNLQMKWQGRVQAGHYMKHGQAGKTATGTNQATAFAITGDAVEFTTVASGTGANLPISDTAMEVVIINAGANNLTVYTNPEEPGTPTINGTTGSSGVAQTHTPTITIYICVTPGTWYTK